MTDHLTALQIGYAQLAALRDVLIGDTSVYLPEKYANEFEAALDGVAKANFDVTALRLDRAQIAPSFYTSNYGTGEKRHTQPQVERRYLLMKVLAALGYFDFAASSPPKHIGFRPPNANR